MIRKLKFRTDHEIISTEDKDKDIAQWRTYLSLGVTAQLEVGGDEDFELMEMMVEKKNIEDIVEYLYGDILKSLEDIKKKASQGLTVSGDIGNLIQDIVRGD